MIKGGIKDESILCQRYKWDQSRNLVNYKWGLIMEINKIEAFDYMLHLFEEWRDNHETIKGKPFPKLTAMKLLFLAAAPKKDGGDDLLDIFDNFYAMPYGPVESDVYNAIQEDKLPSFSVKYRSIEPREGAEPYNAKRYNDKFYHRVRNAVNDLKEKNEKLVFMYRKSTVANCVI